MPGSARFEIYRRKFSWGRKNAQIAGPKVRYLGIAEHRARCHLVWVWPHTVSGSTAETPKAHRYKNFFKSPLFRHFKGVPLRTCAVWAGGARAPVIQTHMAQSRDRLLPRVVLRQETPGICTPTATIRQKAGFPVGSPSNRPKTGAAPRWAQIIANSPRVPLLL